MKNLFVSAIFLLVSASACAQSTGDYRSAGTGAWNTLGTWERFTTGTGWATPTVGQGTPTSAAGAIEIRTTHTVNTPSGLTVSIDQVTINGTLQIDNGSTITIANGTGNDITISSGALSVSGTLIQSDLANISGATGPSGNTSFLSGSIFRHQWTTTEGSIPLASWNSNSTLEITGYAPASGGGGTLTLSTGGNWGQSFGNVTINCTAIANGRTLDFNGLLTTVTGTFTVSSTGSGSGLVTLANSQTYTLNVTGNFSVSAGRLSLKSSSTGSTTVNIGGNFSYSGGTLEIGANNGQTFVSTLNFNGTGTQTFSRTPSFPTAVKQLIHVTVASNSTLNFGTSSFNGSGNFTVSGTVGLGSTNATGALVLASTTVGNLQNSGTRTFNSGSTVVYNGLAAQTIGTGHPGAASTGVNLTISNASNVSYASGVTALTVTGNVSLQSGDLIVGAAQSLTLNGNVSQTSGTDNITVTSTSDLTVNGSGALGNFPFPAGTITFRNFTLNRTSSGSVTFVNTVQINGVVTLTAGDLIFNNQTLTLVGTFSATAGRLSSNASSTLIINGSGAFGTLLFSASGNTLNTLTFNRTTSGTGSLNSTLTITTALNLSNGDFTNTSGLALSNNATVTRSSSSQLLGSTITALPAGQYYNVVYTGSTLTTGLELPTTANDDLLDLTILGGPVTLAQNIIVNSDFSIQNTFNAGTFTISMNGNPGLWDEVGTVFIQGTSTVNINGNITAQSTGTSQFHTVNINAGATLTLPATTTNFSGNLTVDAGSTFNNSNGTIVFNGSSPQSFSGGGKEYYNVTVNNGGNAVQLLSAVNLISVLDVQSGSNVQSGGFLTLVSSNDSPDITGSIASLSTAGADVSGVVNVQRYISSEGRLYRYISSPISGLTAASWSDDFLISGYAGAPGTDPVTGLNTMCGVTINPATASMYTYDEATAGTKDFGYVKYPTSLSSPISQGLGYAALIRESCYRSVLIDMSGPINKGTISLPVTYNSSGGATEDGWNLVGNPYPSAIYWNSNGNGWTKANVSPFVDVRDNASGTFVTLVEGDKIAQGQAFWIKADGGGTPVADIDEDAKVLPGDGSTFYRVSKPIRDLIKISLTKGTVTDYAYYRIVEGASSAYENTDFPNQNNDFFDVATLAGTAQLAVNTVGSITCGEVVAVHTKDMTAGTYSFHLDREGIFEKYDAIVKDKFTGASANLSQVEKYSFSVTSDPASAATDRFEIELNRPALELNIAIEEGNGKVCDEEAYAIGIQNPQPNVLYFAEINGVVVTDTVQNNSGSVALHVSSQALQVGLNTISIRSYNTCTTSTLNEMVQVMKQPVVTAQSASAVICNEGSVSLTASGSVDNVYKWFDSQDAIDPLHTGTSFQTPFLNTSAQYYVAAVNSLGCEGPRTQVQAEVVQYEDASIIVGTDNTLGSNSSAGNQWYLNDQKIEGATSQTLAATKSGTYRVDINRSGCVTSASKEYSLLYATEGKPVTVFPNPVSNHQLLEVQVYAHQVGKVQLVNSVGRVVSEMNLVLAAPNVWTVSSDMSTLPNGFYYVRTIADNIPSTVKVVKAQ